MLRKAISVIKVGDETETIPSYAYDLTLRDKSGKVIILGFMALIKYLHMSSISVLKVFFVYSMT